MNKNRSHSQGHATIGINPNPNTVTRRRSERVTGWLHAFAIELGVAIVGLAVGAFCAAFLLALMLPH